MTDVEKKEEPKEEDISKLEILFSKILEKFLNKTEEDNLKIIKAVDTKKMVIYEPLTQPVGEPDGVGDIYLLEDVESLVNSLNKHNPVANYFHAIDTDDFTIEKAWLNPYEAKLDVDGEIRIIPENLPIAKVVFKNRAAFEYRLNNKLLGLSIGARVERFEPYQSDEIKKNGVSAVRRLVNPHFDFPGSHVAYTEESQGGACSLMNDPIYAEKSLRRPLSEDQKEILVGLGHNLSELSKSLEDSEKNSGLSSPVNGASQGEQPENKTNEGKNMSEDIQKELAALKRELAVEKAVNQVAKYKLDEAVAAGLAEALATLQSDEKTSVLKALDAMVVKADEAVNKAVEIEKAVKAEQSKEENPVLKALGEEQGHSEKVEKVVEKSRLDIIKEETDKLINSKGAK
jgi:hypothetical protein